MSHLPQLTRISFLAAALLSVACRMPAANEPAGKLRIDCEAGIALSIDGKHVGVTTYAAGGALLNPVTPGLRRIVIAKPGFKPEEQTVTVEPGKSERLAVFFLQPDPGAVLKLPAAATNPLQQLADAQRAVVRATDQVNDAFGQQLLRAHNQEGVLAMASERSREIFIAGGLRDAAVRVSPTGSVR